MNSASDYGYTSPGAASNKCVACGSHELNCCDGVPKLEHGSGSWIAHLQNGPVELFERANVLKALKAGYRVETIGQYLGRINAEIRCAQRSA